MTGTKILLVALALGLPITGVLLHRGAGEREEPGRSDIDESALPRVVGPAEQWLPHVLAQAIPARRDGNVGTLAFANELRIPRLLLPRRDRDGRAVFELALRPGTSEFLPGKATQTWGVNGAYLGPTLRAARGDRIRVEVTNQLPEPTTMHWHGMHLPAVADGGPHQVISPGTTWSPSWTINQPSATLWYHPHPHGESADHVYRGLAGMFIVDDPESAALPLPKTYGIDDIPLIVQDKRFHPDGRLDLSQPLISPTGRLGDRILINGTDDPHLNVRSRLVRFRLLNGSNARIYNIGFADSRPFDLVATDGGLLEAPQRLTRIQLSPGERAEIVTGFRAGERVVLRSFRPELGTNFVLDRLTGGDDSFDLLQIRAATTLAGSPAVPGHLATHRHLHVEDATHVRRFELSDELEINGNRMDMNRIDEVVTAGSTEVWEVQNRSSLPHNFHVHLVRFRIVAYGGNAPPPFLRGFKDTVYVPPNSTVRFVVRFGDYTDPTRPYMFHCHLLWHEDHGMMGQFVVVERGRSSKPPDEHRSEHDHS